MTPGSRHINRVLAERAARLAGVDTGLLVPCTTHELSAAAPRSTFSALASERGMVLPSLDDALRRFFAAWSFEDLAKTGA